MVCQCSCAFAVLFTNFIHCQYFFFICLQHVNVQSEAIDNGMKKLIELNRKTFVREFKKVSCSACWKITVLFINFTRIFLLLSLDIFCDILYICLFTQSIFLTQPLKFATSPNSPCIFCCLFISPHRLSIINDTMN